MSTFPAGIYNPIVDDISLATLKGTPTNDAVYGHATVHRNDAAELVAIETYLGTNAADTVPAVNQVLAGEGVGISNWTGTPTLTSLTLTGALSVSGAATFSSTVALNGVPTVANNVALTFASNAGTSSTITHTTDNDLRTKIGTAGKAFFIADSIATDRFVVETTNSYIGAQNGYAFRAYGAGGVNYVQLYHNNSNAVLSTTVGSLSVSANFVYFNTSIFGDGTNIFSLGSVATDWKDVYGQNAYTTVSDAREKRDIQPLDKDKSIAFMRAINGVDYLWNDFEAEMPKHDEDGNIMFDEDGKHITEMVPQTHHRRHSGWLAQQVKEAMDAVGIDSENFGGYIDDTESGKLALRQGEFIPHLLNYIQHVDAKQQELEERIKQLETK